MDDATQKLAQEAWDAREATLFHDAPDEAKAFIAADRAGFLAGFEAAQRPPVAGDEADALLASGVLGQPRDVEPVTDEALWDFANDLTDAWNIEDENPPSLVEQFRDLFVARFGVLGQPRTDATEPGDA